MRRLQNWHVYWNMRNKLSRLDLDGGYTGNIYLLYVRIFGQLYLKNGGLTYWRHGNTTTPEKMRYLKKC